MASIIYKGTLRGLFGKPNSSLEPVVPSRGSWRISGQSRLAIKLQVGNNFPGALFDRLQSKKKPLLGEAVKVKVWPAWKIRLLSRRSRAGSGCCQLI
jgi:hypothetical protein